MKHTVLFALLPLLALVLVTGCSTTRYPREDYPDGRYPLPRTEREREQRERDGERRDREWDMRDREREARDRDRDARGGDRNGRSYPFSALDIPKGHLPPPGECKVWIPGEPPGHQPPPQSCGEALRNAPLGAWVITHEGSRYRVSIFNRTRRNVVDEIRYYLTK